MKLNPKTPVIRTENLYLRYNSEVIFENISFDIFESQTVALTGESGSGKTSFLNLIAGFVTDFSGKMEIFGLELNAKNIRTIRKHIAWLPQEIALQENSVRDLLLAPFRFEANKKSIPNESKITEVFENLALSPALLEKQTHEISGGQKQRVLLASCLLQDKKLILLDEPTSALDETTRNLVADIFASVPNRTVIAATHDTYWMKKVDVILNFDKKNV